MNSILLFDVARKYSIDFHLLSMVVNEYIGNGQYEIYSIRMSKLCGGYESFVKQELSVLVNEALEMYQTLGSVRKITITENKFIMEYKEVEHE